MHFNVCIFSRVHIKMLWTCPIGCEWRQPLIIVRIVIYFFLKAVGFICCSICLQLVPWSMTKFLLRLWVQLAVYSNGDGLRWSKLNCGHILTFRSQYWCRTMQLLGNISILHIFFWYFRSYYWSWMVAITQKPPRKRYLPIEEPGLRESRSMYLKIDIQRNSSQINEISS